MQKVRSKLKQVWIVRKLIISFRAMRNPVSFFKKITLVRNYFSELTLFEKQKNPSFSLSYDNLKPCIYDNSSDTPIDPIYFYQDSWCAGKIFKNKPARHIDIGSKAEMIGIISQFTPTTMVDIRPINLEMPGLSFEKGSILALPYKDNSVESLSSICVVEHIGLGRYGDEIDVYGTEKAIKELIRILKPGGNLYISVPIDSKSQIYFNAHRSFTREHILKLISPLRLIEEKYIYARSLYSTYDKSKGFGTGMYHLTK